MGTADWYPELTAAWKRSKMIDQAVRDVANLKTCILIEARPYDGISPYFYRKISARFKDLCNA